MNSMSTLFPAMSQRYHLDTWRRLENNLALGGTQKTKDGNCWWWTPCRSRFRPSVRCYVFPKGLVSLAHSRCNVCAHMWKSSRTLRMQRVDDGVVAVGMNLERVVKGCALFICIAWPRYGTSLKASKLQMPKQRAEHDTPFIPQPHSLSVRAKSEVSWFNAWWWWLAVCCNYWNPNEVVQEMVGYCKSSSWGIDDCNHYRLDIERGSIRGSIILGARYYRHYALINLPSLSSLLFIRIDANWVRNNEWISLIYLTNDFHSWDGDANDNAIMQATRITVLTRIIYA